MLFTKMPPVYDMVLKKRCCHVTATKLCDPRKCYQFTTWILRGLLPGKYLSKTNKLLNRQTVVENNQSTIFRSLPRPKLNLLTSHPLFKKVMNWYLIQVLHYFQTKKNNSKTLRFENHVMQNLFGIIS